MHSKQSWQQKDFDWLINYLNINDSFENNRQIISMFIQTFYCLQTIFNIVLKNCTIICYVITVQLINQKH